MTMRLAIIAKPLAEIRGTFHNDNQIISNKKFEVIPFVLAQHLYYNCAPLQTREYRREFFRAKTDVH